MINDEVVVRLGFAIFEACKEETPIIMDFIQAGGLEMLLKVIKIHERDGFLKLAMPQLLKSILQVGAKAAINEIRNEMNKLLLCEKCQEALELSKRMQDTGITDGVKIPSSNDRVNRVLMFMENYPDRVEVLCCALDAMIVFSRNGDCKRSVKETRMVEMIGKCFTNNPEAREIVWRVCQVLSILAMFSDEVAMEIYRLEIHEPIIERYIGFTDEPRIQQQIVWFMGSLIEWRKPKSKLQTSELVMTFYSTIMDTRDELVKAKQFSTKERLVPFEVVIPTSVRRFTRETLGEELELKKEKVVAVQSNRRQFIEKPKFGTVMTKGGFGPGEPGLVPDAEDLKVPEAPDWDKKLTYVTKGMNRKTLKVAVTNDDP